MRIHLLAFTAAIAAMSSAAVVFAGETITSTQGNSKATISQSGGGETTRKVIRQGGSQTIIQHQGGNSATIRQSGSSPTARVSDDCLEDSGVEPCVDGNDTLSGIDEDDRSAAVGPDRSASPQRGADRGRHRGRDRRSDYEKRVERDLGIRINPSDDFRRLFLDKL